MLLALWSPKGGSGTSVLTAACAVVLARGPAGGCRVADLDGDQAAIFGLAGEPALGLTDWLRAGADAPVEALDRMAVEVAPGVALLGSGAADPTLTPRAAAEAGAALAVALRDLPVPVVADCGAADQPATRALVEVADASVVVLRGRYLALRRAIRSPALAASSAAVLVDEPGRSLTRREVADVLGTPVIARVPVRDTVARAVDAGVLSSRLPDVLGRAAMLVVARTGASAPRGAVA